MQMDGLLTIQSRVLSKKLLVAQLIKTFLCSSGTGIFISVFARSDDLDLSSQVALPLFVALDLRVNKSKYFPLPL
jgi:hypothetical protein